MPPDLMSEILTKKFKEMVELENKKHGKNKVVATTANDGGAHAHGTGKLRRGSKVADANDHATSHDTHAHANGRPRRGSKVGDPNEHHTSHENSAHAHSPHLSGNSKQIRGSKVNDSSDHHSQTVAGHDRQRRGSKQTDIPDMHEAGNTPIRSRRNSKQHDTHALDLHGKPRKNSKAPDVHEMLQSPPVEEEDDSGLMDEEKMSYEMQMVMDEVSDLHLGEFDKNYTADLVHRVFSSDKYERLHKPRSRDDHDDHKSHRHGHSSGCAEEAHETAFECHVCSMFFDSEQSLDFHCDYSDLHRANLHLREQRLEAAHKEAIRLTGLARKVMKTLFDTLTSTATAAEVTEPPAEKAEKLVLPAQPTNYDTVVAAINAQEAHHHEIQHKWKRALNKVLHRNLAAKFAHILETRINVPTGVEMMYEGSKHFFRTKSTYDLRFLHHETYRIFEIVPTFVPFNHETSELETTDPAAFVPAKRIYLNFDELMKAFFGYNIVQSGLTEGPTNLGTAPHMEQVKGTFHAAEIYALALFVLNRLKIHKSHAPDDALFFDLHKVNHDMLIKELPRRFAPVPIEPEVVRNIWVQRIEDAKKPPVLEKRKTVAPSAAETDPNAAENAEQRAFMESLEMGDV